MLGQLLGPVAGLASSWLDAKTTKQAAEAKLKLTEAEAKAKILLSEKNLISMNMIRNKLRILIR